MAQTTRWVISGPTSKCPGSILSMWSQVVFKSPAQRTCKPCTLILLIKSGNMSGEYDIKTDPSIPPVQHGRCKVPMEYKTEIEKELNDMVQRGIIAKQTELTPWVSSLMYPKKTNGKLRICLNPKDLNKAIIRENHKAPTLEKIAHDLTRATKFSEVDRNKAFFGMHLTKQVCLLTTFNTCTSVGIDFYVSHLDSRWARIYFKCRWMTL